MLFAISKYPANVKALDPEPFRTNFTTESLIVCVFPDAGSDVTTFPQENVMLFFSIFRSSLYVPSEITILPVLFSGILFIAD